MSQPIRRIVIAAALVILICEVFVHMIRPGLPAKRDYLTDLKVKQMDDHKREEPQGVVFAGTSQMQGAVDPEALCQDFSFRWSAYNAALDAATPLIQEHWLNKVVVPRLRPVTVLLGISPLDFVDLGSETRDFYFQSLATRGDWLGRFERRAAGLSTIVSRRHELRSPAVVVQSLLRTMSGVRDPGLRPQQLNSKGFSQPTIPTEEFNYAEPVRSFLKTLAQKWSPNGRQRFALERTIKALQDQNIEVLLLDMPVSAQVIEQMTRHDRTYEDFRRFVRHEAEVLEIPLLDTSTGVTDARLFRDPHHLNFAGAQLFTTLIGRILANGSPGKFSKSLDPRLASRSLATALAADLLKGAKRKGGS